MQWCKDFQSKMTKSSLKELAQSCFILGCMPESRISSPCLQTDPYDLQF